jgi:hypothetical protein
MVAAPERFSNHGAKVFGSDEMQNNVIPIKRGSQDELTKLYLHLLNVALSETARSPATQARTRRVVNQE